MIVATPVHWSTGANPNPLRDDAQKSMMVEYEGRVTHMVALVFIGPNWDEIEVVGSLVSCEKCSAYLLLCQIYVLPLFRFCFVFFFFSFFFFFVNI